MSDSSDIEIIEEEALIEEVVISSSSEEEEPPPSTSNTEGRRTISAPTDQNENKCDLPKSYRILKKSVQQVEGLNEKWDRLKTVEKGIEFCKKMTAEEGQLRLESEKLRQENWRLRKRIEQIERIKKRNMKKYSILNKYGIRTNEKKQIPAGEGKPKEVEEKKKINVPEEVKDKEEIKLKLPKRKVRRYIGGNPQEKEFYDLADKIDDLLHEVRLLWTDVENDEDMAVESPADSGDEIPQLSDFIKLVNGDKNAKKDYEVESVSDGDLQLLKSTQHTTPSLSSSALKNIIRNKDLLVIKDISDIIKKSGKSSLELPIGGVPATQAVLPSSENTPEEKKLLSLTPNKLVLTLLGTNQLKCNTSPERVSVVTITPVKNNMCSNPNYSPLCKPIVHPKPAASNKVVIKDISTLFNPNVLKKNVDQPDQLPLKIIKLSSAHDSQVKMRTVILGKELPGCIEIFPVPPIKDPANMANESSKNKDQDVIVLSEESENEL